MVDSIDDEDSLLAELQDYAKRTLADERETAVFNQSVSITRFLQEDEEEEDTFSDFDHRKLPRDQRRKFDHEAAYNKIMRDFLGPNPFYNEKEFISIYRISIARFNRIKKDVLVAGIPFYVKRKELTGRLGPSLEARLLLPIRILAYGVASHAFFDYYEMSPTMSKVALKEFDQMMRKLYQSEYLRVPTPVDLKNIELLHKKKHQYNGMFGSLDCMHVSWNKCPVAWRGSYKGKEKKPTVVLEAISDYHLYFWHASFGYCGTLNDKTILNLSPFLSSLLDGSFKKREESSGTIPYFIGDEEFERMYVLVDGIYPGYSRFVSSMKSPVHNNEKKFAKWQESARKDIERAFGVLQGKFQYMARPCEEHNLEVMAQRVATCLILHNMCVSDRVMGGDVYATYNPAHSLDQDDKFDVPKDRRKIQKAAKRRLKKRDRSKIGLKTGKVDTNIIVGMTRREEWECLLDESEHRRINQALMTEIGKRKSTGKTTSSNKRAKIDYNK